MFLMRIVRNETGIVKKYKYRVGQNLNGVCTGIFAGSSPNIRSCTVYTYMYTVLANPM